MMAKAFNQVPDKRMAWQDLRKLAEDSFNEEVRLNAAIVIGDVFDQVPDKDVAWQELVMLTRDEDSKVRREAANVVEKVFPQVSNKDVAWQDLIELTGDEDSYVREMAAEALENVSGQVPSKNQVWQDLIRLTREKDGIVQWYAASILGTSFRQNPDKNAAWQDLVFLANDDKSDVRMFAYHAMGKASVLNASEMTDTNSIKSELEKAIAYFERSSQECSYGPAEFCHPFYKTYYAITFQDAGQEEVHRNLSEAKMAVGASRSKDELIKAIDNLAQALMESQRLKDRSPEDIGCELRTYRWYCDKASTYMAAAEESAPGAVRLMRRCNPLLEEKIKAAIEQIQNKSKQVCLVTRGKGAEYERIGAEINRAAKSLSSESIREAHHSTDRIIGVLKDLCKLLPGDKDNLINSIEEINRANDPPDRLYKIDQALEYAYAAIEPHNNAQE